MTLARGAHWHSRLWEVEAAQRLPGVMVQRERGQIPRARRLLLRVVHPWDTHILAAHGHSCSLIRACHVHFPPVEFQYMPLYAASAGFSCRW